MALILAIEPDKKQASQLTAMVRGRLQAEFVLGDTAERALAALGNRVPDLILTSPILSPKDEAALGERLRALDDGAAHVQTLTTPVLAAPHGRGLGGSRAGSVLSALRRDKGKPSTPAGCDPAVFAEQCREYLERAASERTRIEERQAIHAEDREHRAAGAVNEFVAEEIASFDPEPQEAPIVIAEHELAPPIHASASYYDAPADDDVPASLLAAVAALTAEEDAVSAAPIYEPPAPAYQPPAEYFASPAGAAQEPAGTHDAPTETAQEPDDAPSQASYQFVDLDLSAMLDDPETRARRRAAEDEPPVAVYELDPMSLAEFEATVPQTFAADAHDTIDRADAIGSRDVQDTLDAADSLDAIDTHDGAFGDNDDEPEALLSEMALYSPLSRSSALYWPMMAVTSDRARPKLERNENQEWRDLIEALRRDAEQVPMANPAQAGSHAADGARRKRRTDDAPPQDEWGFFDPEQCGFQALLAKLDEIKDRDGHAR